MPTLSDKSWPNLAPRLILPGLVFLFCVYSFLFWAWPNPPAAYDTALAIVNDQWQTGDAIAVQPWWASGIRQHTRKQVLQLRQGFGSAGLHRYKRLWLVSLPGYDNPPPLDEFKAFRRFALDGIHLTAYRSINTTEIVYDFRDHLHEAKVTVNHAGFKRVCTHWSDQRWVCGPQPWHHVGRIIVGLPDDPRPVIWAHPQDNATLEIAFEDVPQGRKLWVNTALLPSAIRYKPGTQVRMKIHINGVLAHEIIHENHAGLAQHRFDLPASTEDSLSIRISIDTPKAHMREFCFSAEVIR